jgi:hypothetical protein
VNTQYGVNTPDERKLIVIALKKLPEKYVMAFSTLMSQMVEMWTWTHLKRLLSQFSTRQNLSLIRRTRMMNLVTIDAKKKKFNKKKKKKINEDGKK